jgi:hypothetical protein
LMRRMVKKPILGPKKIIIESYKKEKIENQTFISNDKYNSGLKKKYFKILLMEQEIEKFKSEVVKINQRVKEFL